MKKALIVVGLAVAAAAALAGYLAATHNALGISHDSPSGSQPDQNMGAAARSNPRPLEGTIKFSGYDWTVKSSQGPVGPGPNYFSSDNVGVDNQGLHLRITHHEERWCCAEVISKRSFGYGAYCFYLGSRVDNLDPNVILGLFTWSDDPAYAHREIDVEVARWGKKDDPTNAQFVVQPYEPPGHLLRFQVPPGLDATTHIFTWKQDSVSFQSLKGHYTTPPDPTCVIKQWTFTGQGTPQAGGENARINLWLMGGQAPTDGKEVEIIIRKFEFAPSSG